MNIRRRLYISLGIVATALAGGTAAWAFWTTVGAGNGSAVIGTLNPPTNVTAAVAGSTVHVAWTGSTLSSGQAASGYYVTRVRNSDSSTAAACGTSPAAPTSAVSCDDLSVPDGTFSYRVTSVSGSWTATSAPSNNVTVAGDTTPPTVLSLNRAGTPATYATSVSWIVTFSEAVTGVDASDFTVVRSGITGSTSITGVTGSGTTYTVTASTGNGDGTLRLDLVDNDSIIDGAGNKLGGTGTGNGNFTGQTYTIDKTTPLTPTMTSPAANLRATVTLQSTNVSDTGGSGVGTATYQVKLSAGSTWSTACVATASPWSCGFDSTSVADGNYDFRVFTTDNAGNNSATSTAVTSRKIDNTAATVSSSVTPAPNANGWNRGTVIVTLTASDSGSGVDKVYYTTNGSTPTTGSTVYTGPITLSADGSNPVKYLAVDLAGNQTTGATATIRIDNTAPTATITCPTGSNVSQNAWKGCIPGGGDGFAGTASDGNSGVQTVEVQIQRGSSYWSGSSWVTTETWLAASGTTTWSYALDRSNLTKNSVYTLSARATDNAGNSFTTPSYTFTYTN
jgi:hypothetical protein